MNVEVVVDGADDVFHDWRQKRRHSVASRSSTQDDPSYKPSGHNPRRRSTFKGVASSVTSMISMKRQFTKRRSSVVASDVPKPVQTMENTYRTEPKEGKEYKDRDVKDFVYQLLEKGLRDEKYNAMTCSRAACDMSKVIKNKVKELNFPRYKIICQVIIGQMGDQGMQTASRCLWNEATDRSTTVSYKNSSLWAVAIIHAVYFD